MEYIIVNDAAGFPIPEEDLRLFVCMLLKETATTEEGIKKRKRESTQTQGT